MSVGSFSQDPLFRAFSSSARHSHVESASDHVVSSAVSNDGATTPNSATNENLPAGSRLFSYMNPTQPSRKSSHSSTDAQTTLASSPSSPHVASVMSPYAAAFQPSASNHYGKNTPFSEAKHSPLPALEEKFGNSLTLQDHDFQQHVNQGLHHTLDAAALHLGHSLSTPAFSSFDGCSGAGVLHYAGNDYNTTSLPTPPLSSSVAFPPATANALPRKISKSSANAYPPHTRSNIAAESIGGTTYFFNAPVAENQEAQEFGCQDEHGALDGHSQSRLILPDIYVYSGPLTNLAHYKPRAGMGFASYFAPNEVKMELMRRQLLCVAQTDPEELPDLPQEVDCYHRLVPLEPYPVGMLAERLGYFGAVTSVYKANSTKTGLAYCLRRIHNYRLANLRCLTATDAWKKFQHSNIVQIREVFTTKAFGDSSVVFVYDYYPTAETLKSKHFDRLSASANGFAGPPWAAELGPHRHGGQLRYASPKGLPVVASSPAIPGAANGGCRGLLPEALIWCYVIQLSSALRHIHAAGLAARTIDPSKLLVVGKSRLLVNCCGLFDLLIYDQIQQPNAIQHYQDDLTNFGRVVLALACNNPMAAVQRDQWQNSIEFVARHYSPDLKNLILYLTAHQRIRNVNDVMPMIGARFYTQLEASQHQIDTLENELTKEADNGRLFRLLSKLGAVNERPEFAMDPQWSETGDRYLLKLFRDYLFHQVTEDGRPWLDLSHVVQSLNKLDAGATEKVALSSRDQQNVLVVSYADLHRCLDQSFQELLRNSDMAHQLVPVRSSGSVTQHPSCSGGGQAGVG